MKKLICLILTVVCLTTALAFPISAGDAIVKPEVLGASIRLDTDPTFGGTQGLRFVARIKKECGVSLTLEGDNINFGIMVAPAYAGTALIVNGGTGVTTVAAKNLMSSGRVSACGLTYDDNYYYFNIVVTGIPAEQYGVDYVVRAYVRNGSTYVYNDSNVSRSVKGICEAIQADAKASSSTKTFATNALAAYGEVGGDIELDGSKIKFD